jgi:hypothetical protein
MTMSKEFKNNIKMFVIAVMIVVFLFTAIRIDEIKNNKIHIWNINGTMFYDTGKSCVHNLVNEKFNCYYPVYVFIDTAGGICGFDEYGTTSVAKKCIGCDPHLEPEKPYGIWECSEEQIELIEADQVKLAGGIIVMEMI